MKNILWNANIHSWSFLYSVVLWWHSADKRFFCLDVGIPYCPPHGENIQTKLFVLTLFWTSLKKAVVYYQIHHITSLHKSFLFVLYFLHSDLPSVLCVLSVTLRLTSPSDDTLITKTETDWQITIRIARTFIESNSEDDCQPENGCCQRQEEC